LRGCGCEAFNLQPGAPAGRKKVLRHRHQPLKMVSARKAPSGS
jgi:hypothetical protein